METLVSYAPKAFMWWGVVAFAYLVGKHGFGWVWAKVQAAVGVAKADFLALEARVSQIEKQFKTPTPPVAPAPVSPA